MSSSRYFRLLEISQRLESMILQIIDMYDLEREERQISRDSSRSTSPSSTSPSSSTTGDIPCDPFRRCGGSTSTVNLPESVNIEIMKALDVADRII